MTDDKKKIMIVDDDEELLEEIAETLSVSGYNTITFSNAIKAQSKIVSEKPDLLLLDMKMPGKTGFQLAHELKTFPDTAGIPIIAMTGHYTGKDHKFLMKTCGVDKCVLKPFDPEMIIAEINGLLK